MKLISLLLLFLSINAFGAGKVQNSDVKSLSEVGNVSSRLINDTKIHSTVSATQLSALLSNLVKQVIPWAIASPASGDEQPWIKIPYAHTIVAAYAVAKTAGTTATTINIYRSTQANIDGSPSWSSIFSTALTMDANERSSATAATPSVISAASGAANDHYKVDVTSVGTGIEDLTVELVVTTN